MQLFNEINARKLGEKEFNVFAGFFNNFLFLGILIATMIIQYLLVQYGGPSVRTTPLSQENHLICLGIGAFSLIWGVIIKVILPARLFGNIHVKEELPPNRGPTVTQRLRSKSINKSGRLNTSRQPPTTVN